MCGARFSVDLDLIPRRNNIDAKQPSGGIGPVVPMSQGTWSSPTRWLAFFRGRRDNNLHKLHGMITSCKHGVNFQISNIIYAYLI